MVLEMKLLTEGFFDEINNAVHGCVARFYRAAVRRDDNYRDVFQRFRFVYALGYFQTAGVPHSDIDEYQGRLYFYGRGNTVASACSVMDDIAFGFKN